MSQYYQSLHYQERADQFKPDDLVTFFPAGNIDEAGRVVKVHRGIGMVEVAFPKGVLTLPVEDLQVYQPQEKSIKVGKLKKALYWASKDRKYRATRSERDSGIYNCPKCRTPLVRAIYKRRDGQSECLKGCKTCMFLIKPCDVDCEGDDDSQEFEIRG